MTKDKQNEIKMMPKLRFEGFSGEWEEQKLKEISNIYDGTHQTPKYVKSGVKFVSVEDINNIQGTKKYITKQAFEKDFKNIPQKDDILMTRITAGIIGATAIVKDNNPLGYYVSLALIRKKNGIDVNFLQQRINSTQFKHELHKRIIHVAFPKKINLGDIGDCKVLIPLLQEQQKIAEFLSCVDEWIQNLREQKELLLDYKKGMMQRLFPKKGERVPEVRFDGFSGEWEEKRLGEIAENKTGSSNRENSSEYGEYAFFDRSVDVRKSSKFLFNNEALIIPGEGLSFTPKYFKGKFDLHQRAYAILNKKQIHNWRYLYYYISYNKFWFNRMAVGTTMPSLRMDAFNKMSILLPSQKEQEKIAELLSSIDNIIDKKQEQIARAEEWKKGVMQQLFI